MNKKLLTILAVAILLLTGFTCMVRGGDEGDSPLPSVPEIIPSVPDDRNDPIEAPTLGYIPLSLEYECDPDVEIPRLSWEILTNSLINSGYLPFNATVDIEGRTVKGVAYVTEDVYTDEMGNTFLGCAFITTEEGLEPEDGLIITPEGETGFDGCQYVWVEVVDIDITQLIYLDHYVTMCVSDSILILEMMPLEAGWIGSSDHDYNIALKKVFDASIEGGMYNYDTEMWTVRPGTEYTPIPVESLYHDIDFESLKEDFERIIKNQTTTFSQTTFDTVYATTLDVIMAMLSQSEGSMDMYSISYLESYRETLGWKDVLTLNDNGAYVFTLTQPADDATRWMYGILFGLTAILSVAVTMALPGLGMGISGLAIAAIAGAALGFSIEMVSQVAIQGIHPSDIDWTDVLITSVIGLATGPFLGTISGLVAGSVGAAVDGFAKTLNHGGSIDSACLAALIGSTMGLAMGGLFLGGATVVNKIIGTKIFNKISPITSKEGDLTPIPDAEAIAERASHTTTPTPKTVENVVDNITTGQTLNSGSVRTKQMGEMEVVNDGSSLKVTFKGKFERPDLSEIDGGYCTR